MKRFLVALALAALVLSSVSYAAPAPQTTDSGQPAAETQKEREPQGIKPLDGMQDYGISSATVNGRQLTVSGWTQGIDNGWFTDVEIRFYIYRASSNGNYTLYASSSTYSSPPSNPLYVNASWGKNVSPGTYIVRAKHTVWSIDDGPDTRWSEYPFCFVVY